MKYTRMLALVVCAVVTGALATAAYGSGSQVNGQGQTHLSASLGFNAKSDLTGQLNYNADPAGPDAGFSAHCSGYNFYRSLITPAGFPEVVLGATCTDKDGATVYLWAAFVDKGEPGSADRENILWSHTLPVTHANAFINDGGVISNGNIQIHD
jgi:hypothetical protein